jgi:hypothetical protein
MYNGMLGQDTGATRGMLESISPSLLWHFGLWVGSVMYSVLRGGAVNTMIVLLGRCSIFGVWKCNIRISPRNSSLVGTPSFPSCANVRPTYNNPNLI